LKGSTEFYIYISRARKWEEGDFFQNKNNPVMFERVRNSILRRYFRCKTLWIS